MLRDLYTRMKGNCRVGKLNVDSLPTDTGSDMMPSAEKDFCERGQAMHRRRGEKVAKRRHSTGRFLCGLRRFPSIQRLRAAGSHLPKQLLRELLLFVLAGHFAAGEAYAGQTYQSGGWTTECQGGRDARGCSLIVPFSRIENGQRADYTLAVLLSTGDIAIVGKPPPVRVVLRIGNNPPMECRESQPCLFPRDRSIDAILQLSTAPVILIDVLNSKSTSKFSLTTHGYQAGLAQIRAWGYFAN